jgi:hypothetical protein
VIIHAVHLVPHNDGTNGGDLVISLRSEDGRRFSFRTQGSWEPVLSDSADFTRSEV